MQQAAFLSLVADPRLLVLYARRGLIVILDAPVPWVMVSASRVLTLFLAVVSMNAVQIVITILTLRFMERRLALFATLQIVNTRTRGRQFVTEGSMILFCLRSTIRSELEKSTAASKSRLGKLAVNIMLSRVTCPKIESFLTLKHLRIEGIFLPSKLSIPRFHFLFLSLLVILLAQT